jgi:hypothetical protein
MSSIELNMNKKLMDGEAYSGALPGLSKNANYDR